MEAKSDSFWMEHAISLAEQAARQDEVPVGAVLVSNGRVIGEGFNFPISHCDPTAHAEIIALRQGAKTINNYRLIDTTLYVTLEPCVMCVGALVHARIKRLVFGAYDQKAGAIESVFKIIAANRLNHRVICEGGVLAERCGKLLSEFFQAKRKK